MKYPKLTDEEFYQFQDILRENLDLYSNEKYLIEYWKDRGGWGGFCSSGYVSSLNRSYLTFAEARAYARSLNLNTRNSWFIETKKDSFPNNIPVAVHNGYKDQWKGWDDFLGKEKK